LEKHAFLKEAKGVPEMSKRRDGLLLAAFSANVATMIWIDDLFIYLSAGAGS